MFRITFSVSGLPFRARAACPHSRSYTVALRARQSHPRSSDCRHTCHDRGKRSGTVCDWPLWAPVRVRSRVCVLNCSRQVHSRPYDPSRSQFYRK